jgi:hypothetical protein
VGIGWLDFGHWEPVGDFYDGGYYFTVDRKKNNNTYITVLMGEFSAP